MQIKMQDALDMRCMMHYYSFIGSTVAPNHPEIEMARFTINTRDVGALEFFVPNTGGYVRLESPQRSGTLAAQICAGGGHLGNTLMATESTLAAVARRWNKQRRAAVVQRGY